MYRTDSAHFFYDSKVFNDMAKWNFTEFLQYLFGFQDDVAKPEVFKKFLEYTHIWDKNPDEFLYNDNRIIIRLHAIIHFISFNNYFVHALFTCWMSFIGVQWIYKAFKFLFSGKEMSLFLVWLLFPGLWFWSSGLLKEGPSLFLMGLLLISLKKVIYERTYSIKNILALFISVIFCFLLKIYVMLPVLFFSTIYFVVISMKNVKRKSLIYTITLLILMFGGNMFLKMAFQKDIISLLANRQSTFLSVSKGGIFLLGKTQFIRLPYDSLLLEPNTVSQLNLNFHIKKGATYDYCEHTHQKDTLHCLYNNDTTSVYKVDYYFAPANATLNVKKLENNFVSLLSLVPEALYITLFKPFFYDARNTLDRVDSIENLIILISFILIIFYVIRNGFKETALIYFLSLAFTVLIIIGISSPNLGAIERYRALIIPFILMSAVMGLRSVKLEQSKFFRFFKTDSENAN